MEQTKKVQQVLWDEHFREELFAYVEDIKDFNAQDQNQWKAALDHICREHFPDADEYKIVMQF